MVRETFALGAVVVVMAGAAALGQRRADHTTEASATPQVQRTLKCEEDEDIVVSLGDNGLPFAFCQQVIER